MLWVQEVSVSIICRGHECMIIMIAYNIGYKSNTVVNSFSPIIIAVVSDGGTFLGPQLTETDLQIQASMLGCEHFPEKPF